MIEVPEERSTPTEAWSRRSTGGGPEQLKAARADGFLSAAVVLMHGYRHPGTSSASAPSPEQIGFTQVSCPTRSAR